MHLHCMFRILDSCRYSTEDCSSCASDGTRAVLYVKKAFAVASFLDCVILVMKAVLLSELQNT